MRGWLRRLLMKLKLLSYKTEGRVLSELKMIKFSWTREGLSFVKVL